MNPEFAVEIFNAIMIGGGTLVAIGSIAILDGMSKRKKLKQGQ